MMKVPEFKTFPQVTTFLTNLMREFERTDKDVLHSNTANKSILLISRNKTVYEITVENDGTLTSTKVREG
jgi:hypothetical protein